MPVAPSLPPFRAQFLAPRFWPTWLGIGLLRLLVLLPVPLLLAFGERIGALAGRLSAKRRFIVRTNLRLCFPELEGAELERRVDAHFRALGAGIFEAMLAWFASDARLAPRGEVIGLEHLDRAMADGTGVLLLTGHFTTLEIGARFIAMHRPFHAMYRPLNNALVDFFMHRWRQDKSGLPALPRDDLRTLVRALRGGRAIWYAPDQTLDFRNSTFVPFFGVPTLTLNATSRLAEMGRARVVPFFPERAGNRYVVRVFPALENFPGPELAADTARISRTIEDGVRLAPDQYFWIHRRFKYRPPGEPDVYEGR